jgi:SAM-dependent methyltransferase
MQSKKPPVCDYEGSDYQRTFWDEGERTYEDRVEAIALGRLLPKSGRLLLDIGAGAGRNAPRYGGFERVVLLDYARSQLRLAQERLGRGEGRYIFVAGDAYCLPFAPAQFDAITMIRTLHHMAEPRLVLTQVRQVLRDGAIFILEYPNKRNLKAILRYILRRQGWNPFTEEPIEFARLNFDFHPRAVRLWLEECGFAVERSLTVSHFRLGWLKRAVPSSVLVALDALLQWSGDWGQFSPSVFVRARAIGTMPPALDLPCSEKLLFRCPQCGHFPLEEQATTLLCKACSRAYPIHDGIYDFRESFP